MITMGNNDLKKFLENAVEGLAESPRHDDFVEIEKIIDDTLASRIKEVMSDLSGDIIEKLEDDLEKRGLNLDGHKTVKGFADHDHSKGGV